MTKLTDKLFVGSLSDAHSLIYANPDNISAVLNVCEEIDPAFPFAYLHRPFADHQLIPKHDFDACMAWLDIQYAAGNNILVHCALGVSRSPTICASFMVKHLLADDINDAIQKIRLLRGQVDPARETFSSASDYLAM